MNIAFIFRWNWNIAFPQIRYTAVTQQKDPRQRPSTSFQEDSGFKSFPAGYRLSCLGRSHFFPQNLQADNKLRLEGKFSNYIQDISDVTWPSHSVQVKISGWLVFIKIAYDHFPFYFPNIHWLHTSYISKVNILSCWHRRSINLNYKCNGIRSGDRIPLGARFSAPFQTRPWVPPSLLHNGYRLSWGCSGRSVVLTNHPHVVMRLKKE